MTDYGLDQNNFEVNLSALSNGSWTKELSLGATNSGLSSTLAPLPGLISTGNYLTTKPMVYRWLVAVSATMIIHFIFSPRISPIKTVFFGFPTLTKYNADTRQGFIRFTLEKQDFLHKDYSYVLARQMIAFGKLPTAIVSGAVYYSDLFGYYVVDTAALYKDYTNLSGLADDIVTRVGIIEAEASGL